MHINNIWRYVWLIYVVVAFASFQHGLRQLDLSLLSQLWALNDSIQEFRTMIEEQDDEEDDEECELDEQGNRRHSPTPSSYDSVSSEGGAEADLVMQAKAKRLGTIPKVITMQPKQQLQQQQQQHLKGDLKPVPRMRSAPPPPPPAALMCIARKAAAPPRPTWCYLTDFLAGVRMVMCKAIVGDVPPSVPTPPASVTAPSGSIWSFERSWSWCAAQKPRALEVSRIERTLLLSGESRSVCTIPKLVNISDKRQTISDNRESIIHKGKSMHTHESA